MVRWSKVGLAALGGGAVLLAVFWLFGGPPAEPMVDADLHRWADRERNQGWPRARLFCDHLLQGDRETPTGLIRRREPERRYSLSAGIEWLAGTRERPYDILEASPTFLDLPPGKPKSCRPANSMGVMGGKAIHDMFLEDPGAIRSVTLVFRYGREGDAVLEEIRIGRVEKLAPGTEAPDAYVEAVQRLAERMGGTGRKGPDRR